jgi:DNA-binding transcriptional LysR family regulator
LRIASSIFVKTALIWQSGSVRCPTAASKPFASDQFGASFAAKSPLELSDHDCVTFEGLSSADAWTFRIKNSEQPMAIHSRLVVNTAEAAIDAAIAGVGMTRVLSYQIAQALMSGALQVALQAFEPAPWPVNLVYGGGLVLPLKLRAFLDFAAPRLKARLSEIA